MSFRRCGQAILSETSLRHLRIWCLHLSLRSSLLVVEREPDTRDPDATQGEGSGAWPSPPEADSAWVTDLRPSRLLAGATSLPAALTTNCHDRRRTRIPIRSIICSLCHSRGPDSTQSVSDVSPRSPRRLSLRHRDPSAPVSLAFSRRADVLTLVRLANRHHVSGAAYHADRRLLHDLDLMDLLEISHDDRINFTTLSGGYRKVFRWTCGLSV